MNKVLITLAVLVALGLGYMLASLSSPTTSSNQPAVTGVTLDLSGKQLTTLSAEVTNRNDVKILNLSNNQLTNLPPEIGNMTNLEELNVENNRLVTLPPEIGKLTKLKRADFSNNRLTSLPLELGSLNNLVFLNLSGYDSSKSDAVDIKSRLTNAEVKF